MRALLKISLTLILIHGCMITGVKAEKSDPRFGFRVAPNIGWWKPDTKDFENLGVSMGFSWGFVTDLPIGEKYSFLTGFNILSANSRLKYPESIDGVSGTMERKYFLKYFELPLMMRFNTADRGGPVFYGQIGLGLNLLLDAKAQGNFKPNSGNEIVYDREKITDEINFFRTALLVGVGVEYPVGSSSKVFGGLLFNNGFTDALKGTNYLGNDNRAIQGLLELNLGFLF